MRPGLRWLVVALAIGSACNGDEAVTEIVVKVVGDGLGLDEARVDLLPETGAKQSKTVKWPSPAATELDVKVQDSESGCNPATAGRWGCIPGGSYEDYRAQVGVRRGGPELQAFGLRGGVEIALSEKKDVAFVKHATVGPVILILTPAGDRDGGAGGPDAGP